MQEKNIFRIPSPAFSAYRNIQIPSRPMMSSQFGIFLSRISRYAAVNKTTSNHTICISCTSSPFGCAATIARPAVLVNCRFFYTFSIKFCLKNCEIIPKRKEEYHPPNAKNATNPHRNFVNTDDKFRSEILQKKIQNPNHNHT